MTTIHIVSVQFECYGEHSVVKTVRAFDTKKKAANSVARYNAIVELLVAKYNEVQALASQWDLSNPSPDCEYSSDPSSKYCMFQDKRKANYDRIQEEIGYRKFYNEKVGFDTGHNYDPNAIQFFVEPSVPFG